MRGWAIRGEISRFSEFLTLLLFWPILLLFLNGIGSEWSRAGRMGQQVPF